MIFILEGYMVATNSGWIVADLLQTRLGSSALEKMFYLVACIPKGEALR
jgi:hypothetical protein